MEVLIGKQQVIRTDHCASSRELRSIISFQLGLKHEDFYLISNGKLLNNEDDLISGQVHFIPTTLGGKGGFGSMLRAIGAQIEKTTNREACRDLSGRRLRDINEEQRLKKWVAQQAEREKEAKERKKKKLEKLCEQPKHEFKDTEYDKERSALPEMVEDAVSKGMEASCKRKADDKPEKIPKKKKKLWVDSDLEDFDSSEEDNSDDGEGSTSNKDEEPVSLGECSSSHSESPEIQGDSKQIKLDPALDDLSNIQKNESDKINIFKVKNQTISEEETDSSKKTSKEETNSLLNTNESEETQEEK